MQIKGINRGKKWFKNDPNLSILRQKSAPKVKISKFAQEMTTVDCGGHSRQRKSQLSLVIDENLTFFSPDLGAYVLNF